MDIQMTSVKTTILISNLHCSSCVNTIRDTLLALSPPPTSISTSIVSQTVSVEHDQTLSADTIQLALDEAGFDLVSTPELRSYRIGRSSSHFSDVISRKRQKHTEQCLLCQQEAGDHGVCETPGYVNLLPKEDPSITSYINSLDLNHANQDERDGLEKKGNNWESVPVIATFSVGGMTCASCVANVTRAASEIPGVSDVAVNLIAHSATAKLERKELAESVVKAIEDGGYSCELVNADSLQVPQVDHRRNALSNENGPYRATFSIGGMTCASCVGNVTNAASEVQGVSEVAVNLVGKSATATFESKDLVKAVVNAIEDGGYEAELISIVPLYQDSDVRTRGPRTISLIVGGMFCRHCPEKIMKALEIFGDRITVEQPLQSYTDPCPVIRLTYDPSPPDLTIRHIVNTIASAKSPPFDVSIQKPLSLEERARMMHAHEQHMLLTRLVFAFIVAIPTFIIGIVYMTLVPASNHTRMWFMEPMWTGNTSRVQWTLFFLATPVMFFSAGQFHRRSIKEIYGLWRRGSKTPVWRRFIRFGSMSLLVSLGVSIAYFASIALLALAAAQEPDENGAGDDETYFDSVVFLTMFLLAGRYLEAYSKVRTADAVSALGKLRPTEALLFVPNSTELSKTCQPDGSDLEKATDEDLHSEKLGARIQKVEVDLLEVGDVVRVPHGATPPTDGIIISREGSQFDESSLTGESKPIKKNHGDQVFVGTINRGKAVEVQVTMLGGDTMLDQIVKVVREGQTKRAPIEKLADVLTGYFVPVITLLAILTFVIWLVLGVSGALPLSYLDTPIGGGWAVWALEFAIAVFVIACPCGIGLAAPTALLVGSGLAAKFGILVRGGGEAFQEAAQLDIVVFDKTGTLTEGGEPQVTDVELARDASPWDQDSVLNVAHALESASSHPLATAMLRYCEAQNDVKLAATSSGSIEEIPGRGLKGSFTTPACDAIIGNEHWIEEHGASFSASQQSLLHEWQSEGKSVIVLAIRDKPSDQFVIVAIFAAADRLRQEAHSVVKALQRQGLSTWMISGDNPRTAKAVAKTAGIPEMNVIGGVLPQQKAEKINYLQQVGKKRDLAKWKRVLGMKRLNERCVVAMVGDGINDAPALSAADVSVAIGSGSDVAISSASFILIKSDLRSLLTLTDLSRKVFRRVKFNFFWAGVYNLIALPIAAGVIYPAGHARLDPVWASLAMALSSVSVVVSSLMLRLYREPKI
ncbi:hypothetical protein ACEPAF_6837 [Sanghuangporus sanghuang]